MNTKQTGEPPMIMRLVLVGLVAALGVTLPSRPECERWMGSVQSWACGVLADWDTWKPCESDAYCLPSESHVTVSDLGRLARVQRLATESSKSSERQRSAAVSVLAADEEVLAADEPAVRTQQIEGKNAGWAPVLPSDHIELAMIVELCRIAEEARVELQQKATPGPDSGPVSQAGAQHAAVRAATMQALPGDVFAPEQPANEIETVTVTVKALALPTDVFAPGEPRAEGQTAIVAGLPHDVFAPAGQGSDQPGRLVSACDFLGERAALTSQPAAPGVEPIEEIGPLDPDLDIFCTIASRLIPDSEEVSTGSLNAVTNSSAESEFTSIEQGPELDQGIECELSRGAEANQIVADKVAIASADLNQSPSAEVGLSAPLRARAGSTGPTPPPELDRAVRLTRDALGAWAHVFAGSGPLKVTTR
jgi:hypothetical protein